MPIKSTLIEYTVCGLWAAGGTTLAMVMEWMPTPEEASKAFVVGLISTSAGLLLRYIWGRLTDKE